MIFDRAVERLRQDITAFESDSLRITDAEFDKRTRDIVSVLEKYGKVEYRRVTHQMAFTTTPRCYDRL